MKSPWKMIGQLIFPHRSSEERQAPAIEDAAHQSPVPDERKTATSPRSPVQPPLEPQFEDVKRAGEAALEAVERDVGSPLPNPIPVDQKAGRATKKSNHDRARKSKKEVQAEILSAASATRPRRGVRRTPSISVKQKVEAAAGRETPTTPVGGNFHNAVADVDSEIRSLTRELAEKLKLQNAQLRKMMERFGGSDT